jgi:hypothetical protein
MTVVGVKLQIPHVNVAFGPVSVKPPADTADPLARVAQAALGSCYYAWHQRDADMLRAVWSNGPVAQLDNTVDGILRGGEAIARLYQQAFAGMNLRSPSATWSPTGTRNAWCSQAGRPAATPLRAA